MSVLAALIAAIVVAAPVHAKPGDAGKGKLVYAARCALCHGKDGDGQGPGAERLLPPPRDFTEVQYKIKTTGFDDIVPNDEDLFRMIRDGMAGTAMPGWSDVLGEQDMWDLVAYLKTLGGIEEEKPEKQVDYGTPIVTSPESIEAGAKLFGDRCAECHGAEGKGDGIKKLKDDAGARTWPRNLTKPWTFRASNAAKDIFARASVGIPGTQMPSFADPVSKKKLTIAERWHVANYVASLAKTEKVPRAANTVVIAEKVEGAAPTAPDDPRWAASAPTTFMLFPQIIAKERLFTPINDTITVRALYGEKELSLLLEWDDRTKSIPGDEKAGKLSEPGLSEDMVAVQLPIEIPDGVAKPYFLGGDAARPVNLWRWQSGTSQSPGGVKLANAKGFGDIEERDAAKAAIRASSTYAKGTWRVVMTRPLAAPEGDKDIGFAEGAFIPIAFAAWDGSNGEKGTKHTMTTWYWLLLKPPVGPMPLIIALLIAALIGVGELWWARSAAAKRRHGEG
jgi:DMSO reductase family type II enzyme heme b subunit